MDMAYLDGRTVVPTDDIKKAFGDIKSRKVGDDMVGDVHVSTVFLGLDHGFGHGPLWFETMIFGGEHDQWQDRYQSYDAAELGHRYVVKRLTDGLSPDSSS